jgi:hypothetical protein
VDGDGCEGACGLRGLERRAGCECCVRHYGNVCLAECWSLTPADPERVVTVRYRRRMCQREEEGLGERGVKEQGGGQE